MYAMTRASGAAGAADVSIYVTPQGIVTHEEIKSSLPTTIVDQHFDEYFRSIWYSGANAQGAQIFVRLIRRLRGPSWVEMSAAGKTTNVLIDRSDALIDGPSCFLILDRGLSASVVLPALVRSTGATVCSFVDPGTATAVTATIDSTPPRTRPKDARPDDLRLKVTIGSIAETIWYDPKTLIPDYVDFGRDGSASLVTMVREY